MVISFQAFCYQAFDMRRKEDAALTPDRILNRYIQFHSHAMKFKEDMVISDFEDTVKKPNRTIERINQKFRKTYKGVEDLQMIAQLVFSKSPERVRPDRIRDEYKVMFGEEFEATASRDKLAEARKIYQRLLGEGE